MLEYNNPIRNLSGIESSMIKFPRRLFRETVDRKNNFRFLIFLFLKTRTGGDFEVECSIASMLKFWGIKERRGKGRINERLLSELLEMEKEGYIEIDEAIKEESRDRYFWTNLFWIKFNTEKYEEYFYSDGQSCGFAILYMDEIKNLISYFVENDFTTSRAVACVSVFIYARLHIYNRSVEIPDSKVIFKGGTKKLLDYKETLARWKNNNPEVAQLYYAYAESEIGISRRTISESLQDLTNMDLIVFEKIKRLYSKGTDSWKNNPTLIANYQKRGKGLLYAEGERYYEPEMTRVKSRILAEVRSAVWNENKAAGTLTEAQVEFWDRKVEEFKSNEVHEEESFT